MSIRVLLVCREGIAHQKYLDACKGLEVLIDTASTYQELLDSAVTNPYNGMMVDIPTKLKALSMEKESASIIFDLFPTLQLIYNEKSGQIRTISSGQTNTIETLEVFITKRCNSFKARTIRSDRRKAVVFNVILSKCKDVSHEDDEKTVIMNISKGGCFIFSNHKWEVGSDAWFIIKELTDQTPIRGQVKWKIDWGQEMSVPGIGIQLMDISDSQVKEICAISRL
jgi:Tfp pilus assembly protein PilZ